ncbi:MAG: tetratricopeptide repeat protein [Deltaproteobacteria bacterium]|nr:tetratricopeptide repeat protein [Deltaproteobacteria bacterium]
MLALLFLSACHSRDQARAVFEAAQEHLGDGDYPGALSKYSEVVSRHQSSAYGPKSQYMIASIQNRRFNDRQKAIESYSILIYIYPESTEAVRARADLAELYSGANDHRKAIEEYGAILRSGPPDAKRYVYAIAMEYVKMNDLRQARLELKGLLDSSGPGPIPQIKFDIANTYYIEGDLKEALSWYDAVISEAPEGRLKIEARFGKARALEEAGRLNEALAIYRALSGDYPNQEALRTRMEWIEKRRAEP